ncbi:MAG: DUF1080 domain-containing protein [Phycisphaerae bacterium]|nr:DUF1080 domain-containing protein [Phycisphaerae bacterium]
MAHSTLFAIASASILSLAAFSIAARDDAPAKPQGAPAQTEAAKPAPAANDGFESIFNGKDLTGWIGDTTGYVVENGAIVCGPNGRNLYTAKEYGDFTLRFEFKLTPGANNGIGIRTPPEGDAAYVGMEIQVLDDSSEKYAQLKPYQYHGSIYGIAPATRGHQKPVGEWNVEEIEVRGRQVKVTLNGAVIVDVNLDEVTKNGTLDGQKHPGLSRDKGHIAFCGHGDRVEYRNLAVKTAAPAK